MSYLNVDNWIVIAEDDRDPHVSWQHHLDRGSLGGVDNVAGTGTPVHAPADGTITNIPNNGTGGNTVTLAQEAGWRDQFMHLSSFAQPNGAEVLQGDLIGYSGATGGDYAPHVHWHRIDPSGARRNPWDYFTATASIDPEPIPDQEEEDEMDKLYNILANTAGAGILVNSDAGSWRGITGGESKALQKRGIPVVSVSDAEFDETKKFLTEVRPK